MSRFFSASCSVLIGAFASAEMFGCLFCFLISLALVVFILKSLYMVARRHSCAVWVTDNVS